MSALNPSLESAFVIVSVSIAFLYEKLTCAFPSRQDIIEILFDISKLIFSPFIV